MPNKKKNKLPKKIHTSVKVGKPNKDVLEYHVTIEQFRNGKIERTQKLSGIEGAVLLSLNHLKQLESSVVGKGNSVFPILENAQGMLQDIIGELADHAIKSLKK